MNCRSTLPRPPSWAPPGMPLAAAAGRYCVPQVVRLLSQLQSGNSLLRGGQKQLPKSSHGCCSALAAHQAGLPPTSGTWRLWKDGPLTCLCFTGMASEALGSKPEPRSRSAANATSSYPTLPSPDTHSQQHLTGDRCVVSYPALTFLPFHQNANKSLGRCSPTALPHYVTPGSTPKHQPATPCSKAR